MLLAAVIVSGLLSLPEAHSVPSAESAQMPAPEANETSSGEKPVNLNGIPASAEEKEAEAEAVGTSEIKPENRSEPVSEAPTTSEDFLNVADEPIAPPAVSEPVQTPSTVEGDREESTDDDEDEHMIEISGDIEFGEL